MGGRGSSSGASKSKDRSQGTGLTGLFEETNETLNASDPKAIDQLRAMAQRGEIPSFISGKREDRERLYEELDRIYGTPPGIMNEYELIPSYPNSTTVMDLEFKPNNEATLGGLATPRIKYVRGDRTSEAVRRGQIKHAIYTSRGELEVAIGTRGPDGYPNLKFAEKYGFRVLSDAEKKQADREINSFVERLLKSPLSKFGRRAYEQEWTRVEGGWIRSGSRRNSDRIVEEELRR